MIRLIRSWRQSPHTCELVGPPLQVMPPILEVEKDGEAMVLVMTSTLLGLMAFTCGLVSTLWASTYFTFKIYLPLLSNFLVYIIWFFIVSYIKNSRLSRSYLKVQIKLLVWDVSQYWIIPIRLLSRLPLFPLFRPQNGIFQI